MPATRPVDVDACPLCGKEEWVGIRDIATGPIADYWRVMGYSLHEDFGPLPLSLEQRQCRHCGLHWFSPLLIGPSAMYEALARNDWYYGAHKWEFREALGFLAERHAKRLLEIGCGTGEFLKQARRLCESVRGIEYNSKAAALCRQIGLDVQVHELADSAEQFDVIAAFQVLEHVPHPRSVLESWIRRLASGGFLVLSVPNQSGVMGLLDNEYLNLPPHHATLWEERSLRHIADSLDLQLLSYLQEPLSIELYSTYTRNMLRKITARPGFAGKVIGKINSLIHGAMIPFFFDSASEKFQGHSHLAIYQRR